MPVVRAQHGGVVPPAGACHQDRPPSRTWLGTLAWPAWCWSCPVRASHGQPTSPGASGRRGSFSVLSQTLGGFMPRTGRRPLVTFPRGAALTRVLTPGRRLRAFVTDTSCRLGLVRLRVGIVGQSSLDGVPNHNLVAVLRDTLDRFGLVKGAITLLADQGDAP